MSYTFKKGQRVVRVVIGAGTKTAAVCTVESVKTYRNRTRLVKLEQDEHLRYHEETGQQSEQTIPGWTSEIIPMEQ